MAQGHPYSAVRLRDDEPGAAEVRKVNAGNEVSSTVRIGRRFLTNPGPREVRAALRAGGAGL